MPDFIQSFEMPKNIEGISSEGLQSNEEIISWFTYESNGRKPDWFVLRSYSLSRKE